MAWKSLEGSIGGKPEVLAGPILRQVTPKSVTVWIATQVRAFVTLTVWDDEGIARMEGQRRTVAVGEKLHIVAVTATRDGTNLKEGVVYQYDMSFDFGDRTSNLKLATRNADLAYRPCALPSFALPPQDLNHLRLLQGSCRMPHAEGKDVMPMIDDLIAPTAANAYARPHQLLLTGDQIYADSVADDLLFVLIDAVNVLLGWQEQLPISPMSTTRVASDFPAGTRYPLLSELAGFTSETKDLRSHLLSLGEYLCMYLFVWSDVLWPDVLPSYRQVVDAQAPNYDAPEEASFIRRSQSVADFSKTVWKVRKVLANVPSYMIFDDHDVTDDWNMTRYMCQNLYGGGKFGGTIGLRIVQNALAAYSLCQHWGNAPDQFAPGTQPPPGLKLLTLLDTQPSDTFADKAKKYNDNSDTIRSLLGVHNDAVLKQQPQNALFHDAYSLRYNYTVEGLGHQVIFTDTRTWRSFPHGGQGPSELLPPAQITSQILNTPDLGDRALLVVLSTNAPPVQPIRSAARHARLARTFRHHPDVYEAWEIPSVPFDRLLATLTEKLPKIDGHLYGRVIFLSGDVHHSFASRLYYSATTRYGDQRPQPATAVIAQLVASSFKKEDDDTRAFQGKKGYEASPWLARALLGVIPKHQPEGYVGWNVPKNSGLHVGSQTRAFPRVGAVTSKLTLSEQPTVALWAEDPKMFYSVTLNREPDYRYRLDYLTPDRQSLTLPMPVIRPLPSSSNPDQRKQAAQTYKAANAHYRLYSGTPGPQKLIGVNNFGEITFQWGEGDNKAVNHTLRWRYSFHTVWTTYTVSLNPKDGRFLHIPVEVRP